MASYHSYSSALPFVYAVIAACESEANSHKSQKVHILISQFLCFIKCLVMRFPNCLKSAETPDVYRAERMVIPTCVSLSTPFGGFMEKTPGRMARASDTDALHRDELWLRGGCLISSLKEKERESWKRGLHL